MGQVHVHQQQTDRWLKCLLHTNSVAINLLHQKCRRSVFRPQHSSQHSQVSVHAGVTLFGEGPHMQQGQLQTAQ